MIELVLVMDIADILPYQCPGTDYLVDDTLWD
jgi:hypothetical protein